MNKIKFSNIKVGDSVIIDKDDNKINAIITQKNSDIKNGMSGIDYIADKGELGWCYTEQILSVIKNKTPVKTKQKSITLKEINFDNIEEGDIVKVKSYGDILKGIVGTKHENIKNGCAGIDFTTENGTLMWCYIDQIVQLTGIESIKQNKKLKP